MDQESRIRAAQIISITTSFLIAGYTLGHSQNGIAELYDEPVQVSTRIFTRIYKKGGDVALPLSIAAGMTAVYLALMISEKQVPWSIAAALIAAIRFWTHYIMLPGIERLVVISENDEMQRKSEQTLEHRQLLRSWVNQNYVRCAAALASGLVGAWASVPQSKLFIGR